MDVPSEARPLLLKALAAYLRSAEPRDLPPTVRRLREFRPRALESHADAVFGLLDDAPQKALMMQWLEKSKAPVAKGEADALRIVIGRDDGWEDRLRALVPAPRRQRRSQSGQSDDEAERVRERIEKAREDVRRAREERDVARGQHRDSVQQAKELTREIERLTDELSAAQKQSRAASDALEKERRRSERAVARARDEAERARKDLKEARREVARLSRELEKALAAPRRQPPKNVAVPGPSRGPRKPLKAPKGRLDDDPETLAEWLTTPRVSLLVDGYNVALTKGGGVARDLSDSRRRLVDGIATLMRMKKASAVVVFDGSDVAPGTARRTRGPVRVEYSAADEIADDYLIARLRSMPSDPVIVVTNDRELQGRAAELGATIATSDQLAALIH